MVNMNIFRVLADVSHTISKCILIWAIHSNKSAEGGSHPVNHTLISPLTSLLLGVSLITQALYAGVFVNRYLDLFWTPPMLSMWNFVLKIFYIISSFYIIFIMMRVYARTRERENAWKLGAYCLGGSVVIAPVMAALAKGKGINLSEILWTFSEILESVCIVPQLLLLRQTTVPTVIDSGYILTLGSYRAFYILNWIVRWGSKGPNPDWRSVICGIVQTAFYVDFAWVYWTRQRVKLRNGGVVDSDDLSRGFLVSRILGRVGANSEDEEAIAGAVTNGSTRPKPGGGGKWGARGISVSADDDVVLPGDGKPKAKSAGRRTQDDDFANMTDEEESEDEGSSLRNPSEGRTQGHA